MICARRCCAGIPNEGVAYVIDAMARGTNVISGIFLGSAFLSLASRGSGPDDPEDPPVTWFGVRINRASSLLALVGMIGGLGGALLMPLLGAIVDHTPHRRLCGILSAATVTTVSLAQFFMSKETGWQWVAYLSILGGWAYSSHCTCIFAYLPELEDCEIPGGGKDGGGAGARGGGLGDGKKKGGTKGSAVLDGSIEDSPSTGEAAAGAVLEHGQIAIEIEAKKESDDTERKNPPPSDTTAQYGPESIIPRTTSRQTAFQFLSEFLFLVWVIIVSLFFKTDLSKDHETLSDSDAAFAERENALTNDLATSKIAMVSTVIAGGAFYAYAWSVLPSRPALHPLPPGTPRSSYVTAGFRKLSSTVRMLRTDFRELSLFLVSVTFADAGNLAFATLAVTYTTSVLEMTSTQSGILFAIVLICAVPGAVAWNKFVTSRIGKIKSCMLGTLLWAVVTTIAPFFMRNPDQKNNAYVFGAIWGCLYGAYSPPQSAVYVSLIPRGQESELMGVYIFAGQVLSWLPPMIFSIMNERGVNMAWGLVMDAFFFYAAFITMLIFVYPKYDEAVEKAKGEGVHEGARNSIELGQSVTKKADSLPKVVEQEEDVITAAVVERIPKQQQL